MGIHCYLAMTAAEIHNCQPLPKNPGWMACHFSSYGTGLSNLPRQLPPGAMIILNDRTPIHGHDPVQIKEQLLELCAAFSPSRILLDLQRQSQPQTETLVGVLTKDLPCPVGVSEAYAHACDGAVFVSPCPVCTPLEKHFAPWNGRELWLDMALQSQSVIIDQAGSHRCDEILEELPEPVFTDPALCCRYHMEVLEDRVIFHLQRGKTELEMLLQQAEALGVTCAVGLYQQLSSFLPLP